MIARVYEETVSLWTPCSEAALRQCGQAAAYGASHDFLRFYTDEHGNRLSIFDDAATLHIEREPEEMLLFLTMDTAVRSVRTDRDTAERLSKLWDTAYQTEAVMEAPQGATMHDGVCEAPLREIYEVLIDGFGAEALPPFDGWYADVHHRYRRGRCRAVSVRESTVAQACAMTVAECDTAALIGAVATRPVARGKGYASACVLTLAAALQAEGKRVLLSPKNHYAHTLYDRLGFTVVGQWGSVKK